MCDIKRISKEKDDIIEDISETARISGATIIIVEDNLRRLKEKANKNIETLSFLL